ncbi:ABC transporter permease [Aurantimonas sp. VKM B-3413]|uniref:ABC transporter permease n=1 Tax=Aurantimonas sp. VKM B-3413 TaxID=2779401 RepID=UPI001E491C7F|nr:ABC transporter permease [Aurantimonas sp. VKM B-3413]MCB8838064.1 ABC transporter permease [Aurantimonas sp. VKM B-3413]
MAKISTMPRQAAPAGSRMDLSDYRAELGVAVALAAMCVLFAVTVPNFLSTGNFVTLLQQTSVVAIIAVGMTMVIITGEIDLSVGSQVGLAGTVFAILTVKLGVPMVLSALIVFAEAAVVGIFIGALRVVWGIPTFITTLGLLSALRGVAFFISDGITVGPMPEVIGNVWYGEFLALPVPIWVMILVVALGWLVLSTMPFGRHLYAIGGDAETARRYGVKVWRLRIAVMVVVQLLAALGGMMLVGRLNAASPTVGELMELDVIAAVIVGGTLLSGGKGRIIGTVLGVLFVAVLRNGMVLNGIQPVIFLIAQGTVIILAVWWSMLRGRSEP